MTLLVTLFLVLINILNNVTSKTPTIETMMTAISAWLIVCILFIFGALCAYGGILFKKYKSNKVLPDDMDMKFQLSKIDNSLVVLFPVAFLVFNTIYWLVCLT